MDEQHSRGISSERGDPVAPVELPANQDADAKAIVLFDGACGMCDRAVRFILRHDHGKRFRFAPQQSEMGKELLKKHGIDPAIIGSIVLVEGDRAYSKSTAVLKISLELNEPWPLLGLLGFVPIGLRDAIYDFIARHRHQWFKPPAACDMPNAAAASGSSPKD